MRVYVRVLTASGGQVAVGIDQASVVHDRTQRGGARETGRAHGGLIDRVQDAVEVAPHQAQPVWGQEGPQLVVEEGCVTKACIGRIQAHERELPAQQGQVNPDQTAVQVAGMGDRGARQAADAARQQDSDTPGMRGAQASKVDTLVRHPWAVARCQAR